MKSKHIIVATAVILITTVILLFYLHSISKKEVVQRFQAEQLVASRQLAREIESYLHDRAQGVNLLSSFPSLQNRDIKKMTADIQTFFDYVKKNHIKSVSVYDEKGTIVYSTAKDVIGRNYGNLDFFQWAAKKENKDKQFVSSLIRKTDDTTTPLPYFRFLIAAPIYQEVKNARSQRPTQKFIGIVTSTIDLEEVVSVILLLVSPHANQEHIYILDKNGTLLYHSEHPEMVLRNIRSQDKTCFQCHTSFDHVETILSGKEGNVEFALKERPKELAGFSSTEFMNISWKIVICLPYQEVSGFVNKSLYMTLILIGIITLTLIVSSTLIYRSNRLKIRAQEEAKQWMEKRKLEDQIRESEIQYRTMIESAHDIVWTLNTQGNFIFINSSGEKLTGHKISDWIGKSFVPLIFHEDLQKAEKIFLQTLKGTPQSYDVRIYDIHGKIVILSVNTVPIYQDGSVVETVSFGRDITEQMQAEESLKASEEKYRRLVENLSKEYFFYRHDRDGVFTYVSNPMTDMLGYSQQEFLTHHAEYHTDNPINKEAVKRTELSIQGEQQAPYEIEIYHKDRSILWLEVTEIPLRDYNGEVNAVEGIAKNITERKQAEEKLKESEKKYRKLFTLIRLMSDTMPDMLWAKDLNKQFIFTNKAMCENLLNATDTTEPIGKTDLFFAKRELDSHPENPNWHTFGELCQDSDAITLKEMKQMQFDEYGNVKGKFLYLDVHKAPLFNDKGELIGVVGSARDITDRKKSEEKIKESKSQLEQLYKHLNDVRENERLEMSREIHDELGQALTALKMDLNWTKENVANKMLIEKKLNSMLNIVSETIKKVQRISAALRPGMFDDLGLIPAVQWYCHEFEERTGLKCSLELEELPTHNSQINLTLFRILQEGLTNIIRHANAKSVEVKLHSSPSKIYLNITDDGIGISKEKIISKDSLGLIGMNERIKQFNGSMEIISSENKGTSLIISIPIIG